MTVRLPVVYRGKPLMPMKASRVNKFIAEKKGKICYDRKLKIHYLKLLVAPSSTEMQPITIGIDPGSVFDGVSVVSDTTHHVNIELIQRSKNPKYGLTITQMKQKQAMNRRIRRSRLRHRPIRFSNRTKKGLSPTIKATVDFRKWLIVKLMAIFPLSHANIEDVRFNHSRYQRGKSFSHAEQGKTEFYEFLISNGLALTKYAGYDTKNLRVNSFGVDKKTADKGKKTFDAHCLDSYVLACDKEWSEYTDPKTGEISTQPKIVANSVRKINRKVIFIEKIVKLRRQLSRIRGVYTSKKRPYGSSKFRYKTGGIPVPFKCVSNKDNICRVKPEGVHSNHPKQWIYINNGRATRKKCRNEGFIKNTHTKNINPKTNESTNRTVKITTK